MQLLAYGGEQIPETQIRIEKNKQSVGGIRTETKRRGEFAQKNYPIKREGAKQVVSDVRFRAAFDCHLGETDDFEESDYYGLRNDFENKASRIQIELGWGWGLKFVERDLETYI